MRRSAWRHKALAVAMSLGLLLSACSKKEEEKITITLKTDKLLVIPAPPPPEPPPAPPRPGMRPPAAPPEGVHQPPAASAPSGEVRPTTSPAPRTAPVTPPPAAPQEARVSPDEEAIRAVVDRQRRAFQTKDLNLYMRDLLFDSPKTRRGVQNLFNQYDEIEATFTILTVQVAGAKAEATILQDSMLKPRRAAKTQTARAKVLWGFEKVQGVWKINETRVIQ